ncbi:MAG: cupin domain-containing protein [Devosia sp.]
MRSARLLLVAPLALFGVATLNAQSQQHGPIGLKLTPILETQTTFTGQPIRFPQGENQLVAVLAEVAPGGQVGRHMHPVPLFVYMLDGTLTIEMEGHGTHAFQAGQGFAEVMHTWHNGRNLGDKPARFLIVFAGQKGTPNLIRP